MTSACRICRFVVLLGMGLIRPTNAEDVIAQNEPLLRDYEQNDRVYVRLQIDDTVSYFHQRMIGEVCVEGDFIRYQFDVRTGALLEHTERWRDDVAQWITPCITAEEAEARVPGEVELSRLLFIAPGSSVYPLDPAPQNPCWVVRSWEDGHLLVTIIDAVTGEYLGRGVPPPYQGYALAGPDWGSCDPYYTDWAVHAEDWFEEMGYDTQMQDTPAEATVQARVGSDDIVAFYELAHGNSWDFHNACPDEQVITAAEIEAWLTSYANMPFTFLGSCNGMCLTGDGSLAYEFRKGVDFGAAVVGYCQMTSPGCAGCFDYSIDWQETLFDFLDQAYHVGYAFDQANLAYPICANGSCMRLEGDSDLHLVPNVRRAYCGDAWDGQYGPFTQYWRPYHLTCDVTVPVGEILTIDSHVTVAFLNNARLIGQGMINADADPTPIRLVRETDHGAGLLLAGGALRVCNSGEISVRD